MLSNKDINFDDERQILTINGEPHAVGDPAIPGEIDALDERVTALEEGAGDFVYLGEGANLSSGSYGRVSVTIPDVFKNLFILVKVTGQTIWREYLFPKALYDENMEITDGFFKLRKWSSEDNRLGVSTVESGTSVQFTARIYTI